LAYEDTTDPSEKKQEMKSSFRLMMFAALAASCICGKLAYAGARPVFGGLYGIQLFDAKTAVGQDGLFRLLFDFNPSNTGTSTYTGSALWIIDPNGSVVASGNPTIPASVGASFLFPYERSNTAIFAQPSGNTTVLFYYGLTKSNLGGTPTFGVWTYNSSGSLIAAAKYGPYGSVTVSNMYFDTNGKIVVKWKEGAFSSPKFAGWVLDEFGSVVSATAFYGPYGNGSSLGKIRTTSSNQQIWPYSFKSGSSYTTTIWTFNADGSAVSNVQSYGPF
jgi:hypothetical protein